MRQVQREDRGDTLVELLVSIVILGFAAVAILAGFEVSISASALGRNQSTSDAYVRTVAEAINTYISTSANYKACASANYYTGTKSSTSAGYDHYTTRAVFDLPAGYTVTQGTATAWNGSAFAACSPSTDYGMQQIVLTVKSGGVGVRQASEQLTVILRRACNAGPYSSASPCQ